MSSAMTPNVLHFKGFNDVLEGRPVQPVGEDLPVGMLDCSLCSVVSSEHYTLGCKHTYCVACFVGIVKKQHTATSLQCPVDGKCFRPRKALPKSTTDPELVRGLLVRCWNNDNGCGYTGTLEDMPAHFRGCVFYRLTCSVCSTSLLRPELASHVEKSHAKRRSKQHDVAVGSSDDPALKKRNSAEFPEDSKNVEFPERFASGDCFRQLAETTANQAASKTADRIKEHNEAFLLEVLSGLELIKDRIFSVAEAININFPPRSVANEDAFHPKSVVRAPEEIQHTEYTWVLEHYSKYRVGVHYIESPLFVMAPGYKVQLKVCIDGIASVQISVSLKIRRGDDERSLRLCWPFQRMCKFRLLDSSGNSGDVARLFTPTQLFRSADDATSPSSGSDLRASGWLDIATIDRTVFERDYVTGDAFSISFTTMSPLD